MAERGDVKRRAYGLKADGHAPHDLRQRADELGIEYTPEVTTRGLRGLIARHRNLDRHDIEVGHVINVEPYGKCRIEEICLDSETATVNTPSGKQTISLSDLVAARLRPHRRKHQGGIVD